MMFCYRYCYAAAIRYCDEFRKLFLSRFLKMEWVKAGAHIRFTKRNNYFYPKLRCTSDRLIIG
jgi:hypothetical protein